MKFRCEREILADVLATASRGVTNSGGTSPVLSGVRLDVADGVLTVTGTDARIVNSRSVPVTVRTPSATSSRTPDSTGEVPPELVAPRLAVARTSARISRSQRNFTDAALLPLWDVQRPVAIVGAVDWGQRGIVPACGVKSTTQVVRPSSTAAG